MIETIDLRQYGYAESEAPADGLLPGRVTELRREQYRVITERGETRAVLKGAFYRGAKPRGDIPCIGDFVLLQSGAGGISHIVKLLPRRSKFSRADFSGHSAGYAKTILEQVVAANFDYVFIASSLNWDFKVSRVIRYITQARQGGGQPVVILTKADLVEDFEAPLAEVRRVAPSVPAHAISSHTGLGLGALGEYLRPGKTAVFLGMSGVGKSSLLNRLMEQDVMTVKAIREEDSRGRHTTTHRQLFKLPSGAMVIDTPGMRELGLLGASEGIAAVFADVEGLFAQCRFSDCSHETEPSRAPPGCAVLAALADGSLPRERWDRYLAQKRETKFADDRAGYLANKKAWGKSITKFSRQIKNGDGKNGGREE